MRRLQPNQQLPPPLELACLKLLWQMGEGRVKDVRSAMARDRKLAYTTVMTILERLVRRGSVRRRKVGRSFVYTPLLNRESLRRLVIQDLVDSLFDGSNEMLRLYLDADFAPSNLPGQAEPLAGAAVA